MPKKKTGQRKKAEKQKQRQRAIRKASHERPLGACPCNSSMVIRSTQSFTAISQSHSLNLNCLNQLLKFLSDTTVVVRLYDRGRV